MKELLIIGARGFGREVYNMLPLCVGYETEFVLKGFLDDKKDALDGMAGYPPIIDSVENYSPGKDDVFTCALGDVNWKKYYAGLILEKGGVFMNIIHTSAHIGRNTVIGTGCIISDNAGISCDTVIGDFLTAQTAAAVGHDVMIGNYCHLGVRSFLGGGSQVGDTATIHTGAIVLPHMKIGNGSIVGAGAVVMKRVKDGDTVYGNPARVL